ncbi:MAG TPA: hypothetical protein VGK49_02810 [Ilumatobacteraceae bacterium]
MRPVATALLLVAAGGLAACGTTTIDTSATTAPPGASTTTTEPLPTDATLDELLPLLVATMAPLDEQIVENQGDETTLERVEAIWDLAEPIMRDEQPELLFGFEQAVGLARSGVERRRPADASKGYKLVVDLVDDALDA